MMPNRQNQNPDELDMQTISETENYVAWISHEPDGETVYHLELGSITLHFFREEWDELNQLINDVRKPGGKR
jgi:hypothetical protein